MRMRGTDQQQNHVFSYISPEQRVRKDHPLRPIRTMVDEILKQLSSVQQDVRESGSAVDSARAALAGAAVAGFRR
jgi:hypothetical protein